MAKLNTVHDSNTIVDSNNNQLIAFKLYREE